MKIVDITDSIATHIETEIFGERKHEGYIDGTQNDNIFVIIDAKTYCIKITEREETK